MVSIDEQVADARALGDYRRIDELLAPVVAKARAGDAGGVDELLRIIDRHRMVVAPIRKLLIDEDDVEDAAQNTLMAVARAIGAFEGRSRFTTWLYTVAEREALQVLRRNQRVVRPGGEDFSGIVDEHQAVRKAAGLFDISHMGRLQFTGADAPRVLDHLVTCRVDTLAVGQIRYGLMCG